MYLHKVVRVPAGIDVVQFLKVLATALLLVDAPHVLRAATCELLLAQRLLRLCTHRRAIVNCHLTLHITPRRFCIKRDAFIVHRSLRKRNTTSVAFRSLEISAPHTKRPTISIFFSTHIAYVFILFPGLIRPRPVEMRYRESVVNFDLNYSIDGSVLLEARAISSS